MNKKLLVGLFSVFMAWAPWSGYAAQTIDAPHRNLDSNEATEDCTYCHFANYQPSDCLRCHNNPTAPYGDSTAPQVVTHKALECQACHNPHVSKQPTGITGAFTGVTLNSPSADMTILTGVTPTPDPTWAAKTSADRGMILWVADGTQQASYEVKAVGATAGTVTVKGLLPAATTSGSFDLRRGQLIANTVTATLNTSYRNGTLAVNFPSPAGNASIFVDTLSGAKPTGICQVCHTTTKYWRSDGTLETHNVGQVCTKCHQHSSGFLVTGCTACHPGVAPYGAPTTTAQLATPATGSQTAGMHSIHATTAGYNFPCVTCHTGTGMDPANPNTIVYGNGIQMGFSWAGYLGYTASYNGQTGVTYVANNHMTVTNTGALGNGSMVCSNTYCHSNGKSGRLGCVTPIANTSPAWDGSTPDPQADTVTCNNCHGYEKTYANPMTSGRHTTHVATLGIPCWTCHSATVGDDGTTLHDAKIIDYTKHVNGVYDVQGGDYQGTAINLSWNPTTQTCGATNVCHPYTRTWTPTDTETCVPKATLCVGDAITNVNPVISNTITVLDNNTLKFVDTSTDPDLTDQVKHYCLGSGFDGSVGYLKVTSPDPNQGNIVTTAPLKGAATPAAPIIRSYPAAYVDITTAPTAPRLWLTYRVVDNSPGAWANQDTNVNPTNGGWTDSGWFATLTGTPNTATTNILPIIGFTPSAVNNGNGTYTFTITDTSVDPDWNDATKHTLFGGGHDGSAGMARILLNTGGGTGAVPVTFTNVPTNTKLSTTVTGTPGTVIWYLYLIGDNHYTNATAQAASPTYQVYGGWKPFTLP